MPQSCHIFALLLLISSYTCADPATEPKPENKWYQVEVFVFANEQSQDSELEKWPQDPVLKYYQPLLEIVSPLDSSLAEEDINPDTPYATTSFDQFTRQQEQPAAGQQPVVQGPEAFTTLPVEQQLLTDVVNKISVRPEYRLLYHRAWRQPIGPASDAGNILIRGGDKFDNHFELEGSISLSVERYLHIHTNLWLSRFVNNLGFDNSPWPVLPEPQITVIRNEALSPPIVDDSVEDGIEQPTPGAQPPPQDSGDQDSGDSAAIGSNPSSNGPSPYDPSAYGPAGLDSFDTNSAFANSNSYSAFTSFDSMFSGFDNRQYVADRTVTLRQHRRMRSNELHFIDHPMMGLLIKITPYERPTEETPQEPLL